MPEISWTYVRLLVQSFFASPYVYWVSSKLGQFGASFALLFYCAGAFTGEDDHAIFPTGDIVGGPTFDPSMYFHSLILVSTFDIVDKFR
jgi:hypothetical protein